MFKKNNLGCAEIVLKDYGKNIKRRLTWKNRESD
jgi:hypothetical protein